MSLVFLEAGYAQCPDSTRCGRPTRAEGVGAGIDAAAHHVYRRATGGVPRQEPTVEVGHGDHETGVVHLSLEQRLVDIEVVCVGREAVRNPGEAAREPGGQRRIGCEMSMN